MGDAELPGGVHQQGAARRGRRARVRGNENLFVGEDGRWREGDYIPAYVRRYPFIFLEQPDKNGLTLGVDEACRLLTQSKDRLLFAAGEPTTGAAVAGCGLSIVT